MSGYKQSKEQYAFSTSDLHRGKSLCSALPNFARTKKYNTVLLRLGAQVSILFLS